MEDFIDLNRWPIHELLSDDCQSIIRSCKAELAKNGMFNLPGFVRPEALDRIITELAPKLESESFNHARQHNIYFEKEIKDLPDDHGALAQFTTSNDTICADQFLGNELLDFYEYPPLVDFLAAVMEKPALYTMPDPLARVNVMSYGEGQALNWHFDRSEFTTTLLLQAPAQGGDFQYCSDLRSEENPNYDGVARLLAGERDDVITLPVSAGTLNVFRGKNTAHRVTPVKGDTKRIISVLSYYETPGKMFTDEERIGFFGRAS